MIQRHQQYVPLGLSVLIHLIVLIILTMYFIPVMELPTWYEVSFSEPDRATVQAAQTTYSELQGIARQRQQSSPVQSERLAPQAQSPQALPQAELRGIPQPQESELIETPSEEITPSRETVSLNRNPITTAILRGTAKGVPGQDSSGDVEHSLEGGLLRFNLKSGYKHSLGMSGWVKLSFRVDANARLVASSITVLDYSGAAYSDEARKVLSEGSFRFEGKPETSITYVITLRFK